MNRKLTITGINILFLIITVVFVTYQLILGIVMGGNADEHLYSIILINEFVFILGPVLIYSLVKGVNFKETFRFNRPGLAPMLLVPIISVPAYLVAAMLNNIVIYFVQNIGEIQTPSIPIPKSIPELVLGILIVGLAPGICEEIMHRGLLLKAYERRGSYRAVVIVSIFFGIFHYDVTNFLGPVFLGIVIGYFVIRTNSIFPGILAHFLNNSIAEILQYLYREQDMGDTIRISWPELQQLILVGFVSLAVLLGLLFLFKKLTEGKALFIPSIDRISADAKAILTHWPIVLIILIYFIMAMLYFLAIALSGRPGI